MYLLKNAAGQVVGGYEDRDAALKAQTYLSPGSYIEAVTDTGEVVASVAPTQGIPAECLICLAKHPDTGQEELIAVAPEKTYAIIDRDRLPGTWNDIAAETEQGGVVVVGLLVDITEPTEQS